jgi:hypothetical protein
LQKPASLDRHFPRSVALDSIRNQSRADRRSAALAGRFERLSVSRYEHFGVTSAPPVDTAATMGLLGSTNSPNPNITVKYYAPTNLATEVVGAAGNRSLNVREVTVTNYQWRWISNLSGVRDNPRANTPLAGA